MNNTNVKFNFIDVCQHDDLNSRYDDKNEQLIGVRYYSGITPRDLAYDIAIEVISDNCYQKLWAALPGDPETAETLLEQCVLDEVGDEQLKCDERVEGLMVYGVFTWEQPYEPEPEPPEMYPEYAQDPWETYQTDNNSYWD